MNKIINVAILSMFILSCNNKPINNKLNDIGYKLNRMQLKAIKQAKNARFNNEF